MIEINPLVVLKDGTVMAADSKITIDDNALFRQTERQAEEDTTQNNYKERIAKSFHLNYIYIGGNIGCLVNGAGLAMATMDIIKHYGGTPANFLDVGGSAEDEQMVEAIKLLNNDPEVDAIFINIFGGILKCDNLANSIIKAAEEITLNKRIILRLKGTNSDKARALKLLSQVNRTRISRTSNCVGLYSLVYLCLPKPTIALAGRQISNSISDTTNGQRRTTRDLLRLG